MSLRRGKTALFGLSGSTALGVYSLQKSVGLGCEQEVSAYFTSLQKPDADKIVSAINELRQDRTKIAAAIQELTEDMNKIAAAVSRWQETLETAVVAIIPPKPSDPPSG